MATSQALGMSCRNDLQNDYLTHHRTKTTKINYTWIIDNLSTQLPDIISHDLSTGAQGSRFDIWLNMHDIDQSSNKGHYSLQIRFFGESPFPVVMKYTFSIVDSNGEMTRSITNEIRALEEVFLPEEIFVTKQDLMANKDKFLPNDQLTLFCEMMIIEDDVAITKQSTRNTITIPEGNLSDNLGDLFVNKIHCDVELIVDTDGQKIQAHKAILIARSSYFRALFKNETEESKNNQVVVNDFSSEVVNAMVKFMYTDRVENLDDMARDLLIIANYYDLERLKSMCEESLYRNLTIQNAAETLVLADLHNGNTLKIHTQRFIKTYAEVVTGTTGFQTMSEKHPKLAIEISTILTRNSRIGSGLSEMGHLLLNAKLSDVTLVIGEEELFAHKVVLGAQSPVFAEIFETLAPPNRFVIKDIESVVMKVVLAYCYTGELREAHDLKILLKVLAVAEVYQIVKLKMLCAGCLEKKLAIDTAVSIMARATDYNATELARKALDFIKAHKSEILSLDSFSQLCQNYPELLFKILALDIKK